MKNDKKRRGLMLTDLRLVERSNKKPDSTKAKLLFSKKKKKKKSKKKNLSRLLIEILRLLFN
jgi:hypothetical protein